MNRIGYLLHRFPCVTDTFIKREIRSLQRLGTDVKVISVLRPLENETTPEIMAEWAADTQFVLPRPLPAIAFGVLSAMVRSPRRFFATAKLAILTLRPGMRGMFYQLAYLTEAILAAEVLRRSRINHVHNHIGDQSGTVTMLAACMAGIGYSITFHGWPVFFDAKYARIKEKVHAGRFTRAISYFCLSQLMMFAETDDPTSFRVVHCGLNAADYPYRPPKPEVRTLFCAARLSPEKGLAVTIQAMKVLVDQGYELALRLAGNGPSREHLMELTRILGLTSHVQFLGYLTEQGIIRELENCDLFVLSSFVEGLPVSAMEAMAIGVPVIATNIAGTGELVEDGKTGLLTRPGDPKVLAEAVKKMIGDYEFRLRVAEAGRKKVLEEFDIDTETAKLKESLLASCD